MLLPAADCTGPASSRAAILSAAVAQGVCTAYALSTLAATAGQLFQLHRLFVDGLILPRSGGAVLGFAVPNATVRSGLASACQYASALPETVTAGCNALHQATAAAWLSSAPPQATQYAGVHKHHATVAGNTNSVIDYNPR